ncbi:NAD-dependent epimerase/dehydratase family protein [Agromyces aurantiacus]|uniref:NAD-dependent epimerase/dehydratase family protein n=1 Tax=Agromyces aurantiacus TaxID=165814 RepID=A0ABV9R0E9_9MICO|nr:NAD(P)-dependent oxidoreductase [Agromyces aurantiacus]MBM7505633.1 nucleoside-diphosphate-sugar epimerase [Agromyces aurantiacus]
MPDERTRVLVTGATGFVGGALLRAFRVHPGVDVRGVGRRRVEDPDVASLDLARPVALPFGDAFRPDVIVHAAARTSQWGTRAQFRAQNVDATANVLDLARRCGTRRVVYVSSTSVLYRPADQFGLTESSPAGPRFLNEYARTKHAGEELVRRHPGEWVVARPRAVFGPGDTTLLPRILEAVRGGRLPFLGDPRHPAMGDLVYIDTLVAQLVEAALRPGLAGLTVNLTNGEPVPIMPTIARLLHELGLPVPRRTIRRAPALAIATAAETAWRVGRLPGEPPLTRYAVWLLASSKTFDDTRARGLFGPPAVGMDEALDRTVAAARAEAEARAAPAARAARAIPGARAAREAAR